MPGEASDPFHAGKLEQWLCGAPLTGDHFHCVVVITNGKFVGVWMPRKTSGAILCGQNEGSSYKNRRFPNYIFFLYLTGVFANLPLL